MVRAGAETLAVDLALAAGRSGVARPPAAFLGLIFEGFFWDDLATVLLVSIAAFRLPNPADAIAVPGGAKEHQLYLQILYLSTFRYGCGNGDLPANPA